MSVKLVIISDADSEKTINTLRSVLKVKKNKDSYSSSNNTVDCFLAPSDKKLINNYLKRNSIFHFDSLKAYLKSLDTPISNVSLSAYLRSLNYQPQKIYQDGCLVTCWKTDF